MGTRVYVLLNIKNGKSVQVAKTLQGKPGIMAANLVDGPPEIVMLVEASDRQKLAELTNHALASVEAMTEGIWLLPIKDGMNSHRRLNPSCGSNEQHE